MNEFYLIEKIISDLKLELSLYEEMYGDSDSVSLLNKSSYADAFSIFQKAMFYEIICRISALFDSARLRRDKNLTFEHLVELCGNKISKDLVLELEGVKYDFKQTGIKNIRNKAYAHYDLKRYLGKKELATNLSYEIVLQLLNNMFSVVRKMGLQSGMVVPDQTILRVTRLKKGGNGISLVSKITK